MKPGKAELTAKHWVAFRPEGVDTRGQLEKALGKTEKALLTHRKKADDARAQDQAQQALRELPKLLAKAIKECDRKTHKDEIKGLQELQKLVDEHVTQLAAQAEQADRGDEESEDKIFEPEYVHKLMKLIRSSNKELYFSFGLDMNAPEACQLLLHRKKSSEMLFKILKKTKRFPNRLMTHGLARPDAEDKSTLVFELAAGANVPPNKIVRIARKMFQQDKKLRFKKLKVVAPNGQTLEDAEPEQAAEATATGNTAADLSQQRQQAEGYMQSWQQALEQVSSQVGNIRQAMSSMREDASAGAIYEALGAYDGLANVQREFPDLDLSKLVDAAARNDQSLYDQTLTQTAREVDQARRELTELRPLLNALDDNPFGIPTNADDTVTRVLEEIATGLGV